MSLSAADRRRLAERVDQIGRDAGVWPASHAQAPLRTLPDVLCASTLPADTHAHGLPEFLRVARLQLHAQVAHRRFAGAGADAEYDLRGMVLFLDAAEDMARTLLDELRAGAPR